MLCHLVIVYHQGIIISLRLTLSINGVPHSLGFVEFSSVDDCVKALSKNREPIGDRYIEVRGVLVNPQSPFLNLCSALFAAVPLHHHTRYYYSCGSCCN